MDDPAAGAIDLPADVTERWPSGEGDARQLSVAWTYARTALAAPDQGELEQAVTLILRLEP